MLKMCLTGKSTEDPVYFVCFTVDKIQISKETEANSEMVNTLWLILFFDNLLILQ